MIAVVSVCTEEFVQLLYHNKIFKQCKLTCWLIAYSQAPSTFQSERNGA